MARTVAAARPGRRRFGCRALFLPMIALGGALVLSFGSGGAAQFRADDWVTDCAPRRPGADCSIIVPFSERSDRGAAGSFALAIDLQSGVLAIVGHPPPLTARLQIDRNPPIPCAGPGTCLFSLNASAAARGQLAAGSIVLIDIATKQGIFHSSLSAKGYRAGLAKIRAWSYPEIPREQRRP